jgi:hypothetical protein
LLQYINTDAAIFLFTFFMAYVFTTLGYHTTYEIQNRSRSLNLQSQKFKFQTSIIDNRSQSHWFHTDHLPIFPKLLTTALLTSSIRIAIFQRTKTFYLQPSGLQRSRLQRRGLQPPGLQAPALGTNAEGYNAQGYNAEGYNRQGYNRQGFNVEGYNADGFNAEGFNAHGFNAGGYNRQGYNAQGYNADGYIAEGYNAEGYNRQGYNRQGYNRDRGLSISTTLPKFWPS